MEDVLYQTSSEFLSKRSTTSWGGGGGVLSLDARDLFTGEIYFVFQTTTF